MSYRLVVIFSVLTTRLFGQDTNYCDWTSCHLPKTREAHFDPYYNGHLCENFDPEQTDYSREYLELRRERISKVSSNTTSIVSQYHVEIDSLFNTLGHSQNGMIGLDYQRIRIHIHKTLQDPKNLQFTIYGRSNVSDNICDFQGTIDILSVHEMNEDYDFPGQGVLFGEYVLYEDSAQKHAGVFKGTFECDVLIDHENRSIKLDESDAIADGYFNRTYVGTWRSYHTKAKKKCIWGDYRLPFTFDFDCGDGEMYVCEKYESNGWTSFNDRSEYHSMDKWWKKDE
ncbi:MAG: hypothetical protein KF905_05490 [Flavobacteriales bacterium]|nr:hypothetical protein [Flavobacteriales bacterium]